MRILKTALRQLPPKPLVPAIKLALDRALLRDRMLLRPKSIVHRTCKSLVLNGFLPISLPGS